MNLNVERLGWADAERLIAFYKSIPERQFFKPCGEQMSREEAERIINEPKRDDVVVAEEQQIVGWGFLRRTDRCKAKELSLGIAVHPGFRRKGIADSLMKSLVALARNVHRLESLRLIVVQDNIPALALYRKHGFELFDSFILNGEVLDSLTLTVERYFAMRKDLCA